MIVLGVCGSLTINHNLAFQKVERPDLVIPKIVEAYQEEPVVIAIDHITHGQTGELMSLGWQFQKLVEQQEINWQPQFLLARDNNDATMTKYFKHQVKQLKQELEQPFQFWLINFSPDPDLSSTDCLPNKTYSGRETGYKYRLYKCNI